LRIAFVVYDGMTTLDFVGVFDPVTRLKSMGIRSDLSWQICARTLDVTDREGLQLTPTQVSAPLDKFDMVIVPGGLNSRTLAADAKFCQWIQTAENVSYKVSVCTGALLLAAAGLLRGRMATTHPNAFDELRAYGVTVVPDRIVDQGDVITARGVTASIDLGLYLCEKLAGVEARERIRLQMDYKTD
jgi:transcriptional regulator GlxA family with amidase domain